MPRSGVKKPVFPGLYNRHLEEMRRLLHSLDSGVEPDGDGGLPVPMDIFETENEIVLELDLPGAGAADVSVVQRGMVLQIEADKLSDMPSEKVRYICLERHFGRFRRSVRLPDHVDACNLRAEFGRGVLRIICPKGAERSIMIKELGCE